VSVSSKDPTVKKLGNMYLPYPGQPRSKNSHAVFALEVERIHDFGHMKQGTISPTQSTSPPKS